MKNYLFKICSMCMVLLVAFSHLFIENVCAEELGGEKKETKGCGEVWSEDYVDGWTLKWDTGYFFDTLLEAKNDEYDIKYSYDSECNRVSKSVNGVLTQYCYEDGRLVSENKDGDVVKYIYSSKNGTVMLDGFEYSGKKYEYVYDGMIIEGIQYDNERVVEYEYFNDIINKVYSVDNHGNRVDKSNDLSFIGNVNSFRYAGNLYENETGWFFDGRYYIPELGRFVDGISAETAQLFYDEYPEWEVTSKIYTEGRNIFNTKTRAVGLSDQTIVARVIMLESPTYSQDQERVAWIIQNRIDSQNSDFCTVNDAVSVVSQTTGGEKQFSTYGSDEYNSFSSYASKPQWVYANELAAILLDANRTLPTGLYYGVVNKLYFSSVKSILENTYADGNKIIGNGVSYYDCWMVPLGNINTTTYKTDLNPYRDGGYNVFCNKSF